MEDRKREVNCQEYEGKYIKGITVSCSGLRHVNGICEDSSIVFGTKNKSYEAIISADGHSSSKYGKDGSKFICESVKEFLSVFEEKQVPEEDVLRFFRSRTGKQALLQFWSQGVTADAKEKGMSVEGMDVREITKEYGTTLNAAVITHNYLMGSCVGDGELFFVKKDGKSILKVNRAVEDNIETGKTLSVCQLKPDYVKSTLVSKEEYRYIFTMTDGISKTYEVETDLIPQIVASYEENDWEGVKTDIKEFMLDVAGMEVSDDVTMGFAILVKDSKLPGYDTFWGENRFFYDSFVKQFSGMGKEYVGAYEIITEEELWNGAEEICRKMEVFEEQGKRVWNPIDENLILKENKLWFETDMLEINEPKENAFQRRLHPKLWREGCEGKENEVYLAGILYELLAKEELYPFIPCQEWWKKGGSQKNSGTELLNQEMLDYLEKLYQGKLQPQEYWNAALWKEKIQEVKKERLAAEEDKNEIVSKSWGTILYPAKEKCLEVNVPESTFCWQQFEEEYSSDTCFAIKEVVAGEQRLIGVVFGMEDEVSVENEKYPEIEFGKNKAGTLQRILIPADFKEAVTFWLAGCEFQICKNSPIE